MKITKRQLKRIIKEERAKLAEGRINYSPSGPTSARDELLGLATFADRAVNYFEEQATQFKSVSGDRGPTGLATQIEDLITDLLVLAQNARNKSRSIK